MDQRVPPTWGSTKGPGRFPYLLVEDDDPVLALSDFRLFKSAGFSVAHCTGPGANPTACPLLCNQLCSLVDSADVVLHGLDPALDLAAAIRHSHPHLAVVSVARGRYERSDAARGVLREDADLSATSSIGTQLHALRKALLESQADTPRS